MTQLIGRDALAQSGTDMRILRALAASIIFDVIAWTALTAAVNDLLELTADARPVDLDESFVAHATAAHELTVQWADTAGAGGAFKTRPTDARAV